MIDVNVPIWGEPLILSLEIVISSILTLYNNHFLKKYTLAIKVPFVLVNLGSTIYILSLFECIFSIYYQLCHFVSGNPIVEIGHIRQDNTSYWQSVFFSAGPLTLSLTVQSLFLFSVTNLSQVFIFL